MVRRIGLMIISILPLTIARHFFYRLFFGYQIIGNSKIGMFNYISCKEVVLQDAVIATFNLIIVSKLTMAPGAFILKRNRIKHLNILAIKERGIINICNFIGAQKTNEGAFNFDT